MHEKNDSELNTSLENHCILLLGAVIIFWPTIEPRIFFTNAFVTTAFTDLILGAWPVNFLWDGSCGKMGIYYAPWVLGTVAVHKCVNSIPNEHMTFLLQ